MSASWWSLQTRARNALESRQLKDHPRMLVEQDLITKGVAWHENQRGSIMSYDAMSIKIYWYLLICIYYLMTCCFSYLSFPCFTCSFSSSASWPSTSLPQSTIIQHSPPLHYYRHHHVHFHIQYHQESSASRKPHQLHAKNVAPVVAQSGHEQKQRVFCTLPSIYHQNISNDIYHDN